MCGIFGAVFRDPQAHTTRVRERVIRQLFLLSESRGKEAAGAVFATNTELSLLRAPVTARKLVRTPEYRDAARSCLEHFEHGAIDGFSFIGHSRLVTDGERDFHLNNQPVNKSGVVGIHNGIIVNHETLWSQRPDLHRETALDSEVIFAVLQDRLVHGNSVTEACADTYEVIEGVANVAAVFDDSDALLLATNNGSLYYMHDNGTFVFASEEYILRKIVRDTGIAPDSGITQLHAGRGIVAGTTALTIDEFALGERNTRTRIQPLQRSITERRVDSAAHRGEPVAAGPAARIAPRDFDGQGLMRSLKRCVRCVLPETMPFVDFDESGLCRYCRTYPDHGTLGLDSLRHALGMDSASTQAPRCVIGVSGGRDSLFGLHYLKTELGLEPVSYTYDWGMVTDLARRNVSRVCSKLGIEHIIVSADIPRKRRIIRTNVEAWLRKPELGTVPLFMAGDKAYFYHLERLRRQTGSQFAIMCENLLERTDFKTGFAGVRPTFDENHVYTMPLSAKIKLAAYYARQFIRNPAYINSSIVDSALAFAYYYVMPKSYLNLFRYVPWRESEVEQTLTNEYGFERASDTRSTWRIGDGTAAFYNYIYFAIAGMTENDCLRSNQVRCGALTRDEALRLVEEENQPRFESIEWYLTTIGIGHRANEILDVIDAAPKRYPYAAAQRA